MRNMGKSVLTEFDEKVYTEGIREEGRVEGRAEGREKEIFCSVQDGDYGLERGAEKLQISVQEFVRRMETAGVPHSFFLSPEQILRNPF